MKAHGMSPWWAAFYVWRWRARFRCHGNPFLPCQYIDQPNDNH